MFCWNVNSKRGPYGNDLPSLNFEIIYETEKRLRLKITDFENKRWQVPNITISNTVKRKGEVCSLLRILG